MRVERAPIGAEHRRDGYRGLIYLSGCDTAVQYDFTPGTSFIEKFGDALLRLKPQSQPEVRSARG